MRLPDPTTFRRGPMVPALAASLLLGLAACTSDAGSSEPASEPASESAVASAGGSTAGEESQAADGGTTVGITGTSFDTDELTISAGEVVTFTNDSSLQHTVTEGVDGNEADDARFNELIETGQSVDITFDEPGDYDVTCLFHSNMNMVVHVE